MALLRKPGTALPPESWAQYFDRGDFINIKPSIKKPSKISKKPTFLEKKHLFVSTFQKVSLKKYAIFMALFEIPIIC